jgi:hypothetical protein
LKRSGKVTAGIGQRGYGDEEKTVLRPDPCNRQVGLARRRLPRCGAADSKAHHAIEPCAPFDRLPADDVL